MIDTAIRPLQDHFRSLKDPRAQHSIDHLLLDMVLITICEVICGAGGYVG
jgi:DDE_Tnp_1-associated